MARALVPLKDLVAAKTRLSGLLAPAERRALAQAMVEDVLSVLTGHPAIERVTLVSDDPGAELLACKYGLDLLEEKTLSVSGLNAVITASCQHMGLADDEVLLVLHGDIPLLTASDIDAALAAREEKGGLLIGCDRHGLGTNLLAFKGDSQPLFAFGIDSCARHASGAAERAVNATIIKREGIGLDVDQPADLGLLLAGLERQVDSHTARLLLGTELGWRIKSQLESINGISGAENFAGQNYE